MHKLASGAGFNRHVLSSSVLGACRFDMGQLFSKRYASTDRPRRWASSTALDDWVKREARPISLRQLTVYGRTLTESRLMSSANYVRTELPTRIAHRLRDLQSLPYAVIANPHMYHVYNLYYKAFEDIRRVPEIRTVADNENYCKIIRQTLKDHVTVIPRLVTGVLESRDRMDAEHTDGLLNTLLRSRISRRVIAEQHLALTDTFNSQMQTPTGRQHEDNNNDFVGRVFLRCNATEVVETCARTVQKTAKEVYGSSLTIPEVTLHGHVNATFPYIPGHLEYIIGEILRNSVKAVATHHGSKPGSAPPIDVLICETPQHVIFRFSDQGGGVPPDLMPHLWSFVKGPRRELRLSNLTKMPGLSAALHDLQLPLESDGSGGDTSLASLSRRAPNVTLGIGLPMSRVYAEYWAGSLELHSMEGYGVDTILQISKLGNKNEQLSSRATMDAL